MSAATAVKTEYYKRPYSFFKEGLTSLAKSICGRIYSFSAKKDFSCRSSYKEFADKFNVSKRQVRRTIKSLIDDHFIEQEFNEGAKSAEYRYIKPVNRNTVVYTPMFFHERIFELEYKVKGGAKVHVRRNLTGIEVDVLSIICGHSLSDAGGFDGSLRGLASQVGCSTPSAKLAVDALMGGALIERPSVAKGRLGSTRYVASESLLLEYKTVCYPKKKKEEETTSTPTPTPASELTPEDKEKIRQEKIQKAKEIADLNAKAERETFYAKRQAQVARRIEYYERIARKNIKYVKAVEGIVKLQRSLAEAELFKPERLPALKQEETRLQIMRTQALRDSGIKEEDLQPQYICPKCKDKGWLPDGRACDCYNPTTTNLPKN